MTATEPTVGFEWDAPAPCPDADEVRQRVEERLGYPVHTGDRAALDAIARVRRTPEGRWDMRIWFITEEGTRRRDLVDVDCNVLAETAVTMVALKVAPKAEPEPEPAEDTPEVSEPLATETVGVSPAPAVPRTQPQAPRRPRRRVGADIRMHGSVGGGRLPRVEAGPTLAANLDVGSVRLELTSAFVRAPLLPVIGGGDVRFTAYTGSVRAGWVGAFERFSVSATAGPELGVILGRGRGLAIDRTTRSLWAALIAGGAMSVWLVPRFGIWAGLDGSVALSRPRFVVDDVGLIYRPAAIGGRALLGVSIRMWHPSTDLRRSRQPPHDRDRH